MLVFGFVKNEWADGEDIHSGAEEAVDGLGGRVDDGLVLVERGIEKDRDAGDVAEAADELPVKRINVAFDGLKAASAVTMSDGGYAVALAGVDLVSPDNERGRIIRF